MASDYYHYKGTILNISVLITVPDYIDREDLTTHYVQVDESAATRVNLEQFKSLVLELFKNKLGNFNYVGGNCPSGGDFWGADNVRHRHIDYGEDGLLPARIYGDDKRDIFEKKISCVCIGNLHVLLGSRNGNLKKSAPFLVIGRCDGSCCDKLLQSHAYLDNPELREFIESRHERILRAHRF
jgi:hypothetical protein